ncbi:MAG: MFS transporter [Cellulomonadaceae bacterium]
MAFGGPYRAVLARPGALAFSSAGLVSRLPMSMVGIGLVLMVQSYYGSYALAGRVSAVFVVAQAIFGPQFARLIDHHGQARVMRPLLAVSASFLTALVVAATLVAHSWWLYAFAAVSGATIGSMGSLVRARWSTTLSDPRELHTAYSLESALDELVFVVGPVLATFLATSVTPYAGLVVPLVAMVGGGYWFLSLRDSEPAPRPRVVGQPRPSVLRVPAMIVIVAVFIAIGAVFGATDVATLAFAEEQGRTALGGVVLAVFALGSLLSGLGYGTRNWLSPLWQRFVIGVVAIGAGASLFFVVTSLPALAAVMFVTGFAIAPTLINGNALVQAVVPAEQLTEGLTYVGAALGVGVSLGASISGARIDVGGAHSGFLVVIVAALTAVAVTLAGAAWLRRDSAAGAVHGVEIDPEGAARP